MAHRIRALVLTPEVAELAQRESGAQLVALAHGLVLLPLEDAPLPPVSALAMRLSHAGAVAYVETEYFGGIGTQTAAVWDCGVQRMPLTTADAGVINAALHLLGVRPDAATDEFAAVGFDRVRSNDDWRAPGRAG